MLEDLSSPSSLSLSLLGLTGSSSSTTTDSSSTIAADVVVVSGSEGSAPADASPIVGATTPLTTLSVVGYQLRQVSVRLRRS